MTVDSQTPAPSPDSAPRLGFWKRLIGIFVVPRRTFEAVVTRPTWLAPLLVVTLLGGAANFLFLSTQVGQQALADRMDEQFQAAGRQMTDEQLDRMVAVSKWIATVGALVSIPVVTLIVAAILIVIFGVIQGGAATFRQVFAAVTHAELISIAQVLFVTPINYVRGSLRGATNLAVLVPFLDDRSLAAKLLGSLDLFLIWILAVLAIGVGVVYRRPARGPLVVIFGIYLALVVLISLVRQYGLGGA